MNIAELYSLTAAQKLDKIYTLEKFYPLPFEKYIIIQPWSKPSKCYSYWQEVIDAIYPILEQENIKIVQVGGKDEKPLNNCYHTQGKTNWGQLQYLISKSQLVLCVDSISAHLAGHYNINLIDLISNNFKECVAPYFGDKNKQIILEPDRTAKNPSFALDEGPIKQIDEIKPEEIIGAINKLLNLTIPIPESVYFGNQYTNPLIEILPNLILNPELHKDKIIQIRCDYLPNFDYNYLIQNIARRKCVVIINSIIELEPLKQLRPNIAAIAYKMQKDGGAGELEFIKKLKKLGVQFRLIKEYSISNPMTEKEIADLKFIYLDIAPIQFIKLEKKDVQLQEKLKYVSNRNIYSKEQVFLSEAALKLNLPSNSNTQIIDSQEFLDKLNWEAEYYYFYKN